MMRYLFVAFFAACISAVISPAPAQTLAGEIDITIVDASGAVVPGARVSVSKAGTAGVIRSVVTSPEGMARASLLDAGDYDIAIDAHGFSKLIRSSVTVGVAQVVRLELTLTAGSVSESITVVGQTPQLEEKSSALGQVYGERQLLDLPLNGRNYLDLGRLSAGAIPSRGSRDQTFSAFGNNGIQNAFVLDGARNENFFRGLQTRTRDLVRPPLDALQEFSVTTSNFSAEYGASAGALVLAVTKSGTNQVHGSAYEFLRNSQLDARDFFAPPGPKPVFIRNQFGGSLGGPVQRDRAWIFGAFEGTSQTNHTTARTSVPSPEQINGVFSTPIFNPFTTRANPNGSGFVRDPFPGGVIPSSLFDPIGRSLLQRFPAPVLPGASNNYVTQAAQRNTNRNGVVRNDLRVTDRDNMFARFSVTRIAVTGQPVLPAPAQTPAVQPANSWSIGYGYTRTFTPALINEARFTWTRQTSDQRSLLARDEIIPGTLDPRVTTSIPTFAATGFATIGGEPASIGNNPSLRSEGIYNVSDNISWSKGRHLLQGGFDTQIIRLTSLSALNGRGSFGFTGVFTQNPQSRAGTGAPIADFLLGVANNVTTGTIAEALERERNAGIYFQDRWTVTPRLTLTAGLRYELFYPPSEAQDRLANFILDSGDALFGQLIQAGDSRKPRALIEVAKKNFGPRLGLAWRLGVQGLVVRAAYGIFYAQDAGTGLTNRLTNNPPFVGFGAQAIVSDQLNPSSGFILSKGSLPRPAPINPKSFVLDPSATSALRSWDQRNLTPYVQQWSLSLQKQLPRDTMVEINYVGNIGIHLLTSSNPNQPLIPGPGSPTSRRPLARYTTAAVIRVAPANRSKYQGMTLRMQKQLSGGVSFLETFTYGHSTDWQNQALDLCDACPSGNTFPNSYDLLSNRGNSDNDVRLRNAFGGIWSLPFGPGRRFVNGGPGSLIFRDWMVSSIWSVQTGTPYSVSLSFDNTNVGSSSRPNRICSGGLSNPDPSRVFDTNCFTTPLAFTYGNAGRNILRGLSVFGFDLMVTRSFPVRFPTETGQIQFRSEFFNLPNHSIFGDPGTVFGTPAFGVIGATAQSNRQIQFALKWVF